MRCVMIGLAALWFAATFLSVVAPESIAIDFNSA
jgi:hypothetical protein